MLLQFKKIKHTTQHTTTNWDMRQKTLTVSVTNQIVYKKQPPS